MGLFDIFKRSTDDASEELTDAGERRMKPRKDLLPGTKILVIDDSPTIVAALRAMLVHGDQFVVLEAFDAESGLDIAEAQAVDIVFLDLILPGMSGFTALRKLRQNEATRSIPVIVMSGNEQAIEEFYVQRIGADDFMKKPFSREEVYARIERLINDDGALERPFRVDSGNAADN